MGYLGQKYNKGIVIQRSEEGSAFQENVDVTVDGDTEITPKVGGGIKKVNITSSGGGSTAKYVDLTDYLEDLEFPGQLVELDKEQLDIEDITIDDVLDRKVIFTVDENYLFTLIDDCANLGDLNYPWINMQLEDFEPNIAWVCAFENVTNIIRQQATSLVIAFAEDGKIYASGMLNVGSEGQHYDFGTFILNNYQEGSLEGDINTREMGVSVNNTEEGASAEARVSCVTRLNEETGEPESAILLYGDQLLFNDQPIGSGSVYSIDIDTNIDIYSSYEDAGTGEDEPTKVRYTVVSDDKWHRGTPIYHNSGSEGVIYESLEEIFDGIINENKNYPDKIILGYENTMRSVDSEEVHHLYGRFTFKLENVWYDERRNNFFANYSAVFQNIGNVYLQIGAERGEMGPDDQPVWYYYFVLTTPINVVSYGAPVFPTDVHQE